MVGGFVGNGTAGFPLGQNLPCIVVGCSGSSTFVFATCDWMERRIAQPCAGRPLAIGGGEGSWGTLWPAAGARDALPRRLIAARLAER